MAIGTLCVREVAVADRNTSVREAAKLMRQNHVGDVVVVQNSARGPVPVGIVTDRDIAISVVAPGMDASVFTVGDLLSRDLVTCREEDGVLECMQQMRAHGVRRMPVVNKGGTLVGIIAVDDLVQLLAEEMAEVAKLISREHAQEVHTRV